MLALYDMDGTLFWGDSQLRFARWILRRYPWRRLYLALVVPAGILRACHILNTEQMKRLFLCYLWGMRVEQLKEECARFCAEELMPALYPELLETIKQHHAAGDTTVLCSASPHWWTRHVGETLGFTHVIGTPLPVESRARVPFMPPVPAPGNNKGANKLIRLEQQLQITRADICYTDSAADNPMISISERAVLVNPKESLQQQWADRSQVLTPTHPKSMLKFALGCVLGI